MTQETIDLHLEPKLSPLFSCLFKSSLPASLDHNVFQGQFVVGKWLRVQARLSFNQLCARHWAK